ncbi:hypothetical protein DIE14_32010 [Burkholderia sp. Bp9017]|nr:hypothetical protein DIE14_32010 [Burkholderia sp. Bp9017]RQZ27861.1 hypothetical protein DIE13_28735 [Burkholderia sp. Bp9016]
MQRTGEMERDAMIALNAGPPKRDRASWQRSNRYIARTVSYASIARHRRRPNAPDTASARYVPFNFYSYRL